MIGSVFHAVSGIFRTIKYVYFGIIILTMLVIFWNNPADQFNSVSAPMETITTRP